MGEKLPQPEGEQVNMMCFHGSTLAGVTGIIHDRKFKTKGFEQGGAGHQGIYAKGFIEYEGNPSYNQSEALRCIDNVATGNKSRCGIIVEFKVVSIYKSLQSGGWEAEAEWVSPTTTTCLHADKNRYCVHPSNPRITALWLAGEIDDIEDDSYTGW